MSVSYFRLNVPPIRRYIDTKRNIDALYQRRIIAQAIRDGREGDISLGKSLQMADEILNSNRHKAQTNDFKLTSKIKQMITKKLKELENSSTIDSDASTTEPLSRENSGDSALSQSDSASLPSVPLSQLGLPTQPTTPVDVPSLKLPELR